MPDSHLDQPTTKYEISSKYRTYIFVLLFLLYFFDLVDRYMVASMFPYIQKEWNLNDTQSGLLMSTVYWSIVVFVLPGSILVDRWSRRKAISMMAVFWSLASMACAFTGSFSQLFIARTFLGIGEAGYAAGGTAIITGLYPIEKRGTYMGLWNASIPLATAVGLTAGGFISAYWGWRAAFALTAIPGFIVAIMFYFIKDYKTVDLVKTVSNEGGTSVVKKMKIADIVKDFFKTPTLIFIYLGLACLQFVATAIITWLPTYFHRTANIPMEQAGLKTSFIMLLAIIGAPLGGFLSDQWVKKRINARLLFSSITTLLSAVLIFAAFYLCEGTTQYIVLLIMGITIMAFMSPASTATQEVVHPGLRAITFALAVICTNLLGGAMGPLLIGAVSDAANIQVAMMILPAFLLIAAILYYLGSLFFERDFNKVEKIELELEG